MPIRDPFTKIEGQNLLRNTPGTGYSANSPVNWQGNLVPDNVQYYSPIRQLVNGEAHYAMVLNPAYNGGQAAGSIGNAAPTSTPPQFQFVFDTIGSVIFRSIGYCRLPLRTIWVKGITDSGSTSTSNTATFAGAVCAPIDPNELGGIIRIWDGGSKVYDGATTTTSVILGIFPDYPINGGGRGGGNGIPAMSVEFGPSAPPAEDGIAVVFFDGST